MKITARRSLRQAARSGSGVRAAEGGAGVVHSCREPHARPDAALQPWWLDWSGSRRGALILCFQKTWGATPDSSTSRSQLDLTKLVKPANVTFATRSGRSRGGREPKRPASRRAPLRGAQNMRGSVGTAKILLFLLLAISSSAFHLSPHPSQLSPEHGSPCHATRGHTPRPILPTSLRPLYHIHSSDIHPAFRVRALTTRSGALDASCSDGHKSLRSRGLHFPWQGRELFRRKGREGAGGGAVSAQARLPRTTIH